MRAIPLVILRMSIFSQLYSFCLLEMHFGVAGELIVVCHCCIFATICVQCCRRNFGDNIAHIRKERFPRGTYNKMKLKKIVPCKILRKNDENSYEIELLENVGISPIFNISDMYPYREYDTKGLEDQKEIQWKKKMLVA
jgi:hypothetical protein